MYNFDSHGRKVKGNPPGVPEEPKRAIPHRLLKPKPFKNNNLNLDKKLKMPDIYYSDERAYSDMAKFPTNFSTKGPGRAYRKSISLPELARMFPDDKAAEKWFEEQRWPNGERYCPDCGSCSMSVSKHPRMPYRCRDCQKFFSVRKGTVMQSSNLGYQKWVYALYLTTTNLRGTSAIHVHRDLGITHQSAWHLMHRIREAFVKNTAEKFDGPVEIDEAFFGGKEKNKHADKKLHAGRGTVGKQAVVTFVDRKTNEIQAVLVPDLKTDTLQGQVLAHVNLTAKKYTDEHYAYKGMVNHESVNHGAGEYVRGMAHTNSAESFWAVLKRAYHGTYFRMSFKHLQRYVNEFAGRHRIRDKDTIEQMCLLARGMIGKRLRYEDLIEGERGVAV